MSRRRRLCGALVAFALSFVVYNLNGRCIPTHDTLPARLLPIALLTTHTLTLDQFGQELMGQPGVTYFYTTDRHGHRVSIYPLIVPLAVTPFFIPVAHATEQGAATARVLTLLDVTEKISASTIAAISVALVWLVLVDATNAALAALLTFAYAFGTETWMIGSQALWQHGMSNLLLAATLLTLTAKSPRASGVAGTFAALMLANRPTNVFFTVAAAIHVLRRGPRESLCFALGAAPVLALLVTYNLVTFGAVGGGYGALNAGAKFILRDLPSGMAGLLVSPGRGLLFFTPFLAFLAVLASPHVRRSLPSHHRLLFAASIAQVPFFGSWYAWTGGECYGPRLLSDMTPALVVALVPVVQYLQHRGRLVFAAAVLYAVAVQSIGAFCYQMGGSGTPHDPWALTSNQYLIEARAGRATPHFAAWWAAIQNR